MPFESLLDLLALLEDFALIVLDGTSGYSVGAEAVYAPDRIMFIYGGSVGRATGCNVGVSVGVCVGGSVGDFVGRRVGLGVGLGVGGVMGEGVVRFKVGGVVTKVGKKVGTAGTTVSATSVGESVFGSEVGLEAAGFDVGEVVSSRKLTSKRMDPGSVPSRKLSISIPVIRIFPRA